jgi:hypothetical protein
MAAGLVSYLRRHHIGLVALCIALTGTAYAATLPRNSVGGPQLKKNAVTSPKVKKSSLLASDFRPGQLPAGPVGATGPRGPEGPRGEAGPRGETGTVDTSNFYDKAASDARFLGATATAVNADQLDGVDASGFAQLLDSGTKTTTLTPLEGGACTNDGPITTAPAGKLVIPFGANFPNNRLVAIPDSTVALGGGQVAAFWKVCNVSNATLDPGTVTTSFVILGP